MSNLTRWEPVREMMTLREAMDRLFDDAFTRPLSVRDGGWSTPAVPSGAKCGLGGNSRSVACKSMGIRIS